MCRSIPVFCFVAATALGLLSGLAEASQRPLENGRVTSSVNKHYVSSYERTAAAPASTDYLPSSSTGNSSGQQSQSVSLLKYPVRLLEGALRAFFAVDSPVSLKISSRSLADALQGKFSRLHLEVGQTTVKGLALQSAAVELQNFVVDLPTLRTTGKIRVYSAAYVAYRIAVPEEGINWLISHNKKFSKDRPPRLELQNGQVVLSGRLTTELFNTAFRLKGRLAARREKEVYFIPDSASLGWFHLPGFLMDMVARKLNPVATIEKFVEMQCCNLRIRDVVVTPGLLTFSG